MASESSSHDTVRRTLCRIVQDHGLVIINDSRRCEGLLRDLCPNDRLPVTLVIQALKEGVPETMQGSAARANASAVIDSQVQSLHRNLALTEDAARWAVESWALAVGFVSAAELKPAVAAQVSATTVNPRSSLVDRGAERTVGPASAPVEASVQSPTNSGVRGRAFKNLLTCIVMLAASGAGLQVLPKQEIKGLPGLLMVVGGIGLGLLFFGSLGVGGQSVVELVTGKEWKS